MSNVHKLGPKTPNVLFGAVMRQARGHESYVGLSFPCPTQEFLVHSCSHKGNHAHIAIISEEGMWAVVPVPIYSKPFLQFTLQYLITGKQMSHAERVMLLDTNKGAIAHLLEAMTDGERKIVTSKLTRDKAFEFGYHGI